MTLSRFWPKSLVGRTVLVLALGLTASFALSVMFYASDRASAVHSAGARQLAERVSGIFTVLDETPQIDRRRTVREYRGPGLRVWWARTTALAPGPDSDERERLMRGYLHDYLGERPTDQIRIRYIDPNSPQPDMPAQMTGRAMEMMGGQRGMEMMDRHMRGYGPGRFAGPGGELLRVSIQLSDETWLNTLAPFVHFRPFWRAPFFGSVLLMTIVVLVISVWAVKRASSPLERFARASERFGQDVNAPPMDDTGPREVRRAARAFNGMQDRLQRFILDRTRMLAAISHDLRTPITRLRLRAEFVEDQAERDKMLGDLDEMEAMIAATMAFARDDVAAEHRRELDVVNLLKSVCADHPDVTNYTGPDECLYMGRPLALKRALANLVGNAVAYGAAARVGLTVDEQAIEISVDDDGPGIPAELLDQVFEPFFRVDASRNRATGGTGLGLSVVRSVATAHGGTVTLKNRSGGGLTAVMRLPMAN